MNNTIKLCLTRNLCRVENILYNYSSKNPPPQRCNYASSYYKNMSLAHHKCCWPAEFPGCTYTSHPNIVHTDRNRRPEESTVLTTWVSELNKIEQTRYTDYLVPIKSTASNEFPISKMFIAFNMFTVLLR